MEKQFKIGDEVVRSKGDYVVGRTGKILNIDLIKKRAQVDWGTWVSLNSMELLSVPYKLVYKKGSPNPKYIKLVDKKEILIYNSNLLIKK